MLDLLPEDVWSKPDYKWLDPCCKSGAILREVAARLIVGLEAWEPDFQQRREHIFRNMLYGTSVTELTAQVARRSVYCSHNAAGARSVVRFEASAGNIPFVPAMHDFGADGSENKCKVCGAPADLERGSTRENYAYAFIHGAYPTKELSGMKFDVIVGNPPYQVSDGGHNASQFCDKRTGHRMAGALNAHGTKVHGKHIEGGFRAALHGGRCQRGKAVHALALHGLD